MRVKGLSSVWVALILLLSVPVRAQHPDLRLVNAVRHDDREAVRALVREQVDVNTRQPDGATALHWAAYLDELARATSMLPAGPAPPRPPFR